MKGKQKRWVALAVALTLVSGSAWAMEAPPPTPSPITGVTIVPAVVDGSAPASGPVATPMDVNMAQSNIITSIDDIYFNDWQPLYMAEQSKDRAANKTFMQALMMHMNLKTAVKVRQAPEKSPAVTMVIA